MSGQGRDDYRGAPNLSRILHGRTLTIGREGEKRAVVIDRVVEVSVGIDSFGIFAELRVSTDEGGDLFLHSDRAVEDEEHRQVGHHGFRWPSVGAAA